MRMPSTLLGVSCVREQNGLGQQNIKRAHDPTSWRFMQENQPALKCSGLFIVHYGPCKEAWTELPSLKTPAC